MADLADEKLVNFSMPWHGRRFLRRPIDIDRMPAAFTEAFAAMGLKVANEIAAPHTEEMGSDSRMTSRP